MLEQPRSQKQHGYAVPTPAAVTDAHKDNTRTTRTRSDKRPDERTGLRFGPGGDRGFAQPTDKHRGGTEHVPPQLDDRQKP